MTALVVEAAASGLTLQDEGRTGLRRHGIPSGGAMDRWSLAVANALVGNPPGNAALESTLAGLRLRVAEGPVLVAVAGPGVTLSIGGRPVAEGQSVVAEAGESLIVSPVRGGVYGYLAVAGGFAVEPEMGSVSTHLRTGLGAPPVRVGDRLPLRGTAAPLAPRLLSARRAAGPIRVMAGPQDDWFAPEALEGLTSATWTVDGRSDRMGMYLRGAAIAPAAGSMVSDGVMPGSIQVPPAGAPIVLLRDAQTTGGYPKIATVITADLDRLAQTPPGGTLCFRPVSRAEAVAALRRYRNELAGLRARPAMRAPDTETLLRLNLIGGVWGAED